MLEYVDDAQGRVTSTQAWTGTQWRWYETQRDSHDNLIATSDARGNQTDYAYDANGNTVAVAKPMVANAQGSFRPTTLISYDANNNIVAYCDPNHTHAVGDDWIGSDPAARIRPGDSLCASELGATRYTWDTSDTEDNDGKLETATTPMGYTVTYTYDNYAMPLTVTGAPITQLNGTAITPTQAFTYTPTGMLASYNKGGGTWALTYDALNRQTSIVDPDPGNPTSCTWYNPDGSVADTVGPNQQAMKAGSGQCSPLGSPGPYASSKTYDADGDVLTSTDYAGSANEAATTQELRLSNAALIGLLRSRNRMKADYPQCRIFRPRTITTTTQRTGSRATCMTFHRINCRRLMERVCWRMETSLKPSRT